MFGSRPGTQRRINSMHILIQVNKKRESKEHVVMSLRLHPPDIQGVPECVDRTVQVFREIKVKMN